MTEPHAAQGHPCRRPRRLFPLAAVLASTMVVGVAGLTLSGAEGIPGTGGGAGAGARGTVGARGVADVRAAGDAREVGGPPEARGAAGARETVSPPGAAGARGAGSARGAGDVREKAGAREAVGGRETVGERGAAGPQGVRGAAGAGAARTVSPAASFAAALAAASPAGPSAAGEGAGRAVLRAAGLGPKTLARVPADARQVLVVKGAGPDANRGTARLYTRTGAGDWVPGSARPTRNALRGWTDDHRSGDLRSPAGVYRIGDAGGLLPNPGTRLPYDRSDEFAEGGTGFAGESLDTAFDHVLAIDYNRVAGVSPLDRARPLGEERGGGIWVHVDHGGPTHGCVSLARADLVALLRELRPEWHPVIAMGDGERLAR
ncbi:L,D-transpeptidase family protein [Streptomyces sp. NPDC088768]